MDKDRKAKFYQAIDGGYSRREALRKAGYKPKSRLSASSFAYKLLLERKELQSGEYGPIPADLPAYCQPVDVFPWNPKGQWVRFSNGEWDYKFPKGSGAGAFTFDERLQVLREMEDHITEYKALKEQIGAEGMQAYQQYCQQHGYLNLSEWVAAGQPKDPPENPHQGWHKSGFTATVRFSEWEAAGRPTTTHCGGCLKPIMKHPTLDHAVCDVLSHRHTYGTKIGAV
jgi:hypothetical protein